MSLHPNYIREDEDSRSAGVCFSPLLATCVGTIHLSYCCRTDSPDGCDSSEKVSAASMEVRGPLIPTAIAFFCLLMSPSWTDEEMWVAALHYVNTGED